MKGRQLMKYEWLDEHILSKPAAEKIYQPLWEAHQYKIEGKIFALAHLHKNNRLVISVKLFPEFGDMLRFQYKDIIAGYHLNKRWWNSIYLDGCVPDDVLREMLDQSYSLIFESLPKRIQKQILDSK